MKRSYANMRSARGFSLVELMVAMGLSLVLLAGALSILYSSKVTNAENERLARLQEAGRTVVELILRDGRAAGFIGCSRPIDPEYFQNNLIGSTDLLWNMGAPMQGYNANGGVWAPALPAEIVGATPGSDVLVMRTAREGMPVFRLSAPVLNASSPLQVARGSGDTIATPATMVVGDCSGATAFNVTSFIAGTPDTATLLHAAGGAAGTNATASVLRTYKSGSLVTPVDTLIYYVAPSTSGLGPALWRLVSNDPGGALPLIEGVENLQVVFGVDTNSDLLVDAYQTAATVDAAGDWPNVISLTLSVLVRTESETNLELDARGYNLLGVALGPFNDRRQRSVFTTTVTLRNRTT